jgi:arachidonate 15-lipoxygenase
MIPSLPQKDSSSQQQQRKQELAQLQGQYVYAHDTRVQPLGVAQSVPAGQNFSFVWGLGVLNQALGLTTNLISIASRIFDLPSAQKPALPDLEADAFSVAHQAFVELKTHHFNLAHLFDKTHILSGGVASEAQALAGALPLAAGMSALGGFASSSSSASSTSSAQPALPESLERLTLDLGSTLGELLKFLASKAFELLMRFVGLYGQAPSLATYQDQFQLLPVPPSASTATGCSSGTPSTAGCRTTWRSTTARTRTWRRTTSCRPGWPSSPRPREAGCRTSARTAPSAPSATSSTW